MMMHDDYERFPLMFAMNERICRCLFLFLCFLLFCLLVLFFFLCLFCFFLCVFFLVTFYAVN